MLTRIAVVGCGYVGGVTAACFAALGNNVLCIDVNPERIARYRTGKSPIFEPGLDELIAQGIANGRLSFRDSYPDALDAEIIFVAVNTPGSQEGAADLRSVRDAVSSIAPLLRPGSVIVNKSTVPIGTGELVEGMARRAGQQDLSIVSNPEFLREGSAIRDFMQPDRVVLGSNDPAAMDRVAELYCSLGAPIVRVDIRTAEMIKYASNAFLATKISFINEIAAICEALGADVTDVAHGMGLDSRIGPQFLSAGLGWGGSCFPKDVRALAHMAAVHGAHPQLLNSVMDINRGQRLRVVAKLRQALGTIEGSNVLILGAAFKSNTDDIRNSPPLELASLLLHEGANVRVFDPVVRPDAISREIPGVRAVREIAEGAFGADAVVLATDWPICLEFDYGEILPAMNGNVFVDGRNVMDSTRLRAQGFEYLCLGRPTQEGAPDQFDSVSTGAVPAGAR
jgi:UDPglucose 6-dehydrogenase